MVTSKISICNLALAALGEDSIRDFDEGNKRARMCDVFYEATRDYLLSAFNWPFARKQLQLNMLAEHEGYLPEGSFAYALPEDCHHPIDLLPEGSMQEWEVRGEELICQYGQDKLIVLLYTKKILDPTKFSSPFTNLLSTALAVRLAMPITHDKELTKTILQQFEAEKREAWATDANIGNTHLHSDDDANKDSFVDADFSTRSAPHVTGWNGNI